MVLSPVTITNISLIIKDKTMSKEDPRLTFDEVLSLVFGEVDEKQLSGNELLANYVTN